MLETYGFSLSSCFEIIGAWFRDFSRASGRPEAPKPLKHSCTCLLKLPIGP